MSHSYDDYMDQTLNIKTQEIIYFEEDYLDLNRTESTPYLVLDQLIESGLVKAGAGTRLVDVGCGLGRALFYFHHSLDLPVVGVEANPLTFSKLEANRAAYFQQAGQTGPEIVLFEGPISAYNIQPEDQVFYLFNPFSPYVFDTFLDQIRTSAFSSPRPIRVIFYYPTLGHFAGLKRHGFKEVASIKTDRSSDPREQILVYDLDL